MNKAERRKKNQSKWKTKLKKLWHSWGKSLGLGSTKYFKDIEEFEKSDSVQSFKNTRTPSENFNKKFNSKDHNKQIKKNKEIPEPEEYSFEECCCDCDFFETEECPHYGKVHSLTKWRDVCKDFNN